MAKIYASNNFFVEDMVASLMLHVSQHLYQGFFKENVRYPVWICRDPICLILGIRFEMLGTQIGSLKRFKKTRLYASTTS